MFPAACLQTGTRQQPAATFAGTTLSTGRGSAGQPGPGGAHGGAGLRTNIAGPNYPIGVPGPGGGNGWLCGGGGGIVDWTTVSSPPNGAGGGPGGPYACGGNAGSSNPLGNPGTYSTGGGG